MAENQMPEIHTNKVVTTESKGAVKGPSTLRKFARLLFTDDPEQAARNLTKNVIEPLFRKSVVDAVATFMLGHPIFGNSPFNPTSWNSYSSPTSTSQTPYWTYGNTTTPQPPSSAVVSQPVSGGARFNGTVFFNNYQDAASVLEELNRVLREYKMVRLLELYDAANIDGMQYVSNNWGWTDLTGSQIYPSGNGYILQLPPLKVLN